MANIPIKWGKVGTDGKAEVNGADNTTFSSSSPAFKVNGDEEITGDSSVGGNQSVTGDENIGGNETVSGNLIVNKDNTTNKVGINISNPTEALDVDGNVQATKFIGDLQGNSDTATKSTQDGDGNTISSTYAKVTGDPTIFKNSDMPQGAANLSATATTHRVTVYRNGLSIPYQMDNPNDGGILRVRGTSESTCILELGTWDDSGSGETIQFNYYPTTSQITPTYSASVPKVTGTLGAFTATPASGKVIVTDGTAGGMKASGYGIAEGNTASTIVARNSSSYVYATYYNASCGNDNGATSGSYALYANSDNWIRKCSMGKMYSALGGSGCVQLYSGNLGKGSQTSFNYGSYSAYVVIFRIDGVDSGFVLAVFPKGKLGTSAQWHGYSYDGYNWAQVAMWYSGSTAYVKVDGSNANTQVRWVYGLY